MGPAGWMNANLRTTFEKVIKRAGLTPCPRLFHNLRASRETELVKEYPVQVVTSWLGNTPRIALKHCLMVRKEDVDPRGCRRKNGAAGARKGEQGAVHHCTRA
jgi:hypothetical protein